VSVISALKKEVSPADAKAWAMETFANYGGKRELFKCLGTPEDRAELIAELRSMALRKLPTEVVAPETNPLFDALRAHPDRAALFRKCLRHAMPWADANLNGDFRAEQDQYRCVIGVANAKEFDKEFGAEFRKATPTEGGFNSMKIRFEEMGIPGKLTCYIEFSGLPLTALRQLGNWRQSYDRMNTTGTLPVNTHKQSSVFLHPLKPTTDELTKLEEDFRIFVEAIALGVLRRRNNADVYEIRREGTHFSIGSERLIRSQGQIRYHREEIHSQVKRQLDSIRRLLQLGALCVLYEFYAEETYTSRVVGRDEHESIEIGLGHFVCSKLHQEYAHKFFRGASINNIEDPAWVLDWLRTNIDQWSMLINGSEEDGYLHEVAGNTKPKRVVLPGFFASGWLEQVLAMSYGNPVPSMLLYVAAEHEVTGPFDMAILASMVQNRALTTQSLVCRAGAQRWTPASTVPELAPFFVAAAPALTTAVSPPVMPAVWYHVVIDGQPSGPYDITTLEEMFRTQAVTKNSMVWTQGMGDWQMVYAVPDLMSMIASTEKSSPTLTVQDTLM
jgi:hypothetical protein